MACPLTVPVEKRAGEVKRWGFNLTPYLARVWFPGYVYQETMAIRPPVPTGFQYRALNDGQSSSRQPRRWPVVLGDTIVDGGVTWEAEQVTSDSLERNVSSVEWILPDDFTLEFQDEQTAAGQVIILADIGGGLARQRRYEIVARVTYTVPPVDEFVLRVKVT